MLWGSHVTVKQSEIHPYVYGATHGCLVVQSKHRDSQCSMNVDAFPFNSCALSITQPVSLVSQKPC